MNCSKVGELHVCLPPFLKSGGAATPLPPLLLPLCSVLIKGGVLISGVVCLYVAGTMPSVLIKGGGLISGVIVL